MRRITRHSEAFIDEDLESEIAYIEALEAQEEQERLEMEIDRETMEDMGYSEEDIEAELDARWG